MEVERSLHKDFVGYSWRLLRFFMNTFQTFHENNLLCLRIKQCILSLSLVGENKRFAKISKLY